MPSGGSATGEASASGVHRSGEVEISNRTEGADGATPIPAKKLKLEESSAGGSAPSHHPGDVDDDEDVDDEDDDDEEHHHHHNHHHHQVRSFLQCR